MNLFQNWMSYDVERAIKGVDEIKDEKQLKLIAKFVRNEYVRHAALARVEDMECVEYCAIHDESYLVRRAAARRLCNTTLLQQIALEDDDYRVQNAAVRRIKSLSEEETAKDDKER